MPRRQDSAPVPIPSAAVLAAALLAAACAGTRRDPDPTPLNPTAALEVRTAGSGMQDIPAFEGTVLTYTRANMRRTESRHKGGGAVARPADIESGPRIERLDRKLVWTLDDKARRARQCPLKGCPVPAPKKNPGVRPADGAGKDATCRLKTSNMVLIVEPTGKKRRLNGFDVTQYAVKWATTFHDNASRRSTGTVDLDIWTAETTGDLRDALAAEKAFEDAHGKLGGADAEADYFALLPPAAAKMIASYLAPSVSPTDRAAFLAGPKKADKVPGVPILTTVRWNFSGEACAGNALPPSEAGKPLFTLTSEVRVHRMEPRHDSLFAVPKDYKITK
ncbi:MAG TPA: hypothetical protein VFV71_02605 [Burkholderiales bacterium]|nr:hypothetical protein [Burkholderiales bacterium]